MTRGEYVGIEDGIPSYRNVRPLTTVQFEATLVKPIETQMDRDGRKIDPAGVEFDPERDYPISWNFNRSAPPLGHARVSRADDGSLVVSGELFGAEWWGKDIGARLAIGVIVPDGTHERGGVIPNSQLMDMALTREHADPEQPPIVIHAKIRKERTPMNLVRLGHYHVPTGPDDSGYCQTALVVGVDVVTPATEDQPAEETVNLMVWDHDGDHFVRRNVAVGEPDPTKATFHLSGDCPWRR